MLVTLFKPSQSLLLSIELLDWRSVRNGLIDWRRKWIWESLQPWESSDDALLLHIGSLQPVDPKLQNCITSSHAWHHAEKDEESSLQVGQENRGWKTGRQWHLGRWGGKPPSSVTGAAAADHPAAPTKKPKQAKADLSVKKATKC